MKKAFSLLFIGATMSLLISGCANREKKASIERKIRHEKPVRSQKELLLKGHNIILHHPSLTHQQREKMQALYNKTYVQSAEVRKEMGKVKGVFFKELMSKSKNNRELEILKRKLLRLNAEKMNIMLDAMLKSREILGKRFPLEELDLTHERFHY